MRARALILSLVSNAASAAIRRARARAILSFAVVDDVTRVRRTVGAAFIRRASVGIDLVAFRSRIYRLFSLLAEPLPITALFGQMIRRRRQFSTNLGEIEFVDYENSHGNAKN